MRIKRVVLEHHGDVAVGRADCVDDLAVDRNGSVGDRFQPGDHPEQSRLAAAGGTNQHAELAVRNGNRDTLHRLDIAGIDFSHVLKVDGRHQRSLLVDFLVPRNQALAGCRTLRRERRVPQISRFTTEAKRPTSCSERACGPFEDGDQDFLGSICLRREGLRVSPSRRRGDYWRQRLFARWGALLRIGWHCEVAARFVSKALLKLLAAHLVRGIVCASREAGLVFSLVFVGPWLSLVERLVRDVSKAVSLTFSHVFSLAQSCINRASASDS